MTFPLFFEEDLPESIRSKYEAVIVAGLRARELQRGVKPLIEGGDPHKFTTTAMLELLESKIDFDRGDALPPVDDPMQDPLT
jgi:DNA-directed RNA polymerase omega subunit